jgi:hypothetical protein
MVLSGHSSLADAHEALGWTSPGGGGRLEDEQPAVTPAL